MALAVGRTWSGGLFSALAPVSVVGGPLRTGRSSEIARVIRIGLPPHGALAGGALVDGSGHALGVITSMDIRGTTVVIPAALAWQAARDVVARGGARQGFLGVSSLPVALPARQRTGGHDGGLLVSGMAGGTPAEQAGLLVGDVIVAFDGVPVREPDELLTLLRGDRVGRAVPLEVLRGGAPVTVPSRWPSARADKLPAVPTPPRVFVSAATVEDRRRLHEHVRQAGWRLVEPVDDADLVLGPAAEWPASTPAAGRRRRRPARSRRSPRASARCWRCSPTASAIARSRRRSASASTR